MRDYRKSPSFWPFTADWFWSVKFVSPSKSIKRIQWDSFPYWAVIALVIGKLRPDIYCKKKKTQILIFDLHGCSCEELDSVGNTRLLLMPKCCLLQWIFFLWLVELCSGGKRFDWANVCSPSFFSLPAGCRLFSRGVIFTRARVSLALLSLRKNGGLLVV